MRLTHRFEDRGGFDEAINHIESLAPEQREGAYLVEFDLQEFLEPLRNIWVFVDNTLREMSFCGIDERALRYLRYDCTECIQTTYQ